MHDRRASTAGDANHSLVTRRMRAQHLAAEAPRLAGAEDVVGRLGAVQAQDYAGVKWALALRLAASAPTEQQLEQAISEGKLLRTHAMRGTWQLVTPEDLRWIVATVAPRVIAASERRYRELELDARTLHRSNKVLVKALSGGEHLTRSELAAALEEAGIATAGQRLSYLLQRAELDGFLCSGARNGKQTTHALVDARVPDRRPAHEGEAALLELARRYFQSRGPATLEDFRWWSGLTAAETRLAVEALRPRLLEEQLGGTTYFSFGEAATPESRTPLAQLLPSFDEYFIGYRDRSAQIEGAHLKRLDPRGGVLDPCVVLDGRVIGKWGRTLKRSTVDVNVQLFEKLTAAQGKALGRAAAEYGAFLELEPVLRVERG